MKHVAKSYYIGRKDIGIAIVPHKYYRTHCGLEVEEQDIIPENAKGIAIIECDECYSTVVWEGIDNHVLEEE